MLQRQYTKLESDTKEFVWLAHEHEHAGGHLDTISSCRSFKQHCETIAPNGPSEEGERCPEVP